MELGVQRVLGHNFGNNLGIPKCLVKPFSFSEFGILEDVLYVLFLRSDALRGDGSSEEVNLCCTKKTFVHCQFKACLLDAFEGCSQVGNELVRVIGCNADVIHIRKILVRFVDFIEVFSHSNET